MGIDDALPLAKGRMIRECGIFVSFLYRKFCTRLILRPTYGDNTKLLIGYQIILCIILIFFSETAAHGGFAQANRISFQFLGALTAIHFFSTIIFSRFHRSITNQ